MKKKANVQFKNYEKHFEELLQVYQVKTIDPLVSCIISYDSTRAITVTKKSQN